MTSKFTREELLNIIETDHVQCGEASALARMALAAMDSESGYLPLDYLQGHKDGLEWAAQLAEANHPETGDWLYDDPIELAKAIRKGPDMPPAQPVADSEPVIVVGDDGGDALSYRRLIQSFEPGTKLYLHAQSVPVVSADLLHTAASAIEDLLTTKDRTGACVWFDLPFRLRSAANAQPAPVVPAVSDDIGEIRVGRLPTMNQDDYPGLGDWWVQLRIGEDSDEVLARVYGATPQEANNRAEALACRAAMLSGGKS
ncbi:hypothetical protein ACOIES_10290 [Klebsiella pneumoniae]|uniref:hypothetical protein n=1 Tax=Klebsiella pneumoniae TaxID=573 RepID=UPI003B5A8876